MNRKIFVFAGAWIAVLACSSTSTSPSTSDGGTTGDGGTPGGGDTCGVSGSKTLAATTDAERGTICDCTNLLEGGYGKSFACDGGITVTNKKDQPACLAAWTPCTNATVADGVACAHSVAEHDRCDLGAAIADPRCAYILSCQK
jgi:hypothetical protein